MGKKLGEDEVKINMMLYATPEEAAEVIFDIILTELKAIRELNEDTCRFIEPKAKINPANK